MKLVLVGFPSRDAFAIGLMVRKDHPGWLGEPAPIDQSPWPDAELVVVDSEGWQSERGEDGEAADWADAIGERPAVIVTPMLSQREDLRVEAEQQAAAWAQRGWVVVRRPFHAADMREALSAALRGPAAAAPVETPPVPSAVQPPAAPAAALTPAPVAEPSPVPTPAAQRGAPVGAGDAGRATVTEPVAVQSAPSQPRSSPPLGAPSGPDAQIDDGALTLQMFERVIASSPHPSSHAILGEVAQRLRAQEPFEVMVTMLNGAIFHPAQGWVASNTPASVFGMVLRSRVLSTQLQIIPLLPHVDLRQRAERRGMTIHPVEALLYVLATAAECRLPE